MEKFTTHTGVGVPLRRSNVDTDQIIPAVYLKRVTKTGFEDALFAAWRGDAFSDCARDWRNGRGTARGPFRAGHRAGTGSACGQGCRSQPNSDEGTGMILDGKTGEELHKIENAGGGIIHVADPS